MITKERILRILSWANPKRGMSWAETASFTVSEIEQLCDLALYGIAAREAGLVEKLQKIKQGGCDIIHEECHSCLAHEALARFEEMVK